MKCSILYSLILIVIGFGATIGSTSLQGCFPFKPTGGSPPISVGGSIGTGGVMTTGGTTVIDIITGGAKATGGSKATTGGMIAFIEPTCPVNRIMKASVKVEPRIFGWNPEPNRLRGSKIIMKVNWAPISNSWGANDASALDQDGIGCCVGDAVIDAFSFKPFGLHGTQSLAIDVYKGATRLDNGCAWNVVTCIGSYPPTDNGSYIHSGLQAALSMVKAGKLPAKLFGSYSTADSFDEMVYHVNTTGPCIIGTYWYESMMQTVNCSHLNVDMNTKLMGGHARAIIGIKAVYVNGVIDINNSMVEEMNSWSNAWGGCVGSRCGYHLVSFADEMALINKIGEIDCPDL